MDQGIHDRRGCNETVSTIQQDSNENSNELVEGVATETVVVIRSAETGCVSGECRALEVKDNSELNSSKVVLEGRKMEVSEGEKHSCVIDVKGSAGGIYGENLDGERVCRICHLSSDQAADVDVTITELMMLGCGCKDDLGIAHVHCAEAWFKLKGNRLCEICGETAKNVTGVGDNRFMEEWDERRFVGSSSNSSDTGGGCWRGQPFCNFLMLCLVIAFILPWFFRVNMF